MFYLWNVRGAKSEADIINDITTAGDEMGSVSRVTKLLLCYRDDLPSTGNRTTKNGFTESLTLLGFPIQ